MKDEEIQAFENDFRKLCDTHSVYAVFVLVKDVDEKGSKLMIGGASDLCDFVERSLLPNTVEAGERKQ